MTWLFGGLEPGCAGAILADPPWHFKRYSDRTAVGSARHYAPQDHYSTMTDADICALPVGNLAAENCVLFLWAVFPKLPMAFEVITAWGFTYKTAAFVWMKANATQIELFEETIKPKMGMGYWTRSNAELCLLATRGAPKRLSGGVRQGIIEPRREHSRKPACVYDRIESLVGGPYVELFARNTKSGWSSWGNEMGKHRAVA